jgi:hypothetical protein
MPRHPEHDTPPDELAEIVAHVRRAREAQRRYFETRDAFDLGLARAAESPMAGACLGVIETPDDAPAAALARLALGMLYAQRNYYRGKTAPLLREAKALEARVDAEVFPDAQTRPGQAEFSFEAEEAGPCDS